ncbi:MAG: hypothetical protein GX326_07935 [Clostridiaceae bacterium]|nr:hypothetical protein [Clostridiaceae bacterium]
MQEVFYHIYPLGFCGAPEHNDGKLEHRILHMLDWLDHIEKLGVTALYLGPVFESDRHGYDTRDYNMVDTRLGTKEDLQKVLTAYKERGIKIILDGVFNHAGRGCPFFQDVIKYREQSQYKDWFYIDFNNRDNPDGFSYANWEGHAELVKWNLDNPAVKNYLLSAVDGWINDYQIDGIRLDVAYTLNQNFLADLNHFCKQKNPDFFLLGEMIGGDYNYLLNDGLCDSVTNYECRKGIYSALNSKNLFEIAHSLQRQFGSDPWSLYTDKKLYSFIDNHDVDRIASIINDQRDLPLVYSLIFAMPGIPAVYYGSEWGALGQKINHSDAGLRPYFSKPEWNDLTDLIAKLAKIHQEYDVLYTGDYQQLYLTNEQFAFSRNSGDEQLIYCMNIADQPVQMQFDTHKTTAQDLISGELIDLSNGVELKAKTALILV